MERFVFNADGRASMQRKFRELVHVRAKKTPMTPVSGGVVDFCLAAQSTEDERRAYYMECIQRLRTTEISNNVYTCTLLLAMSRPRSPRDGRTWPWMYSDLIPQTLQTWVRKHVNEALYDS